MSRNLAQVVSAAQALLNTIRKKIPRPTATRNRLTSSKPKNSYKNARIVFSSMISGSDANAKKGAMADTFATSRIAIRTTAPVRSTTRRRWDIVSVSHTRLIDRNIPTHLIRVIERYGLEPPGAYHHTVYCVDRSERVSVRISQFPIVETRNQSANLWSPSPNDVSGR